MMGMIAYVETRAPTWKEIQDCTWIVMTDEVDWDPLNLNLHPRSKEEEEMNRLVASVRIHDVVVDARPNESQIRNPTHESDVILSSVSSALTDATMVPRMIASIRVATYLREDDEPTVATIGSKQRHSAVNAEELARKWRIGLETARKTLKVTTQFGIRHALHPLRRRYRTDHMALRYQRLRTTFYTDTMFSKVTSIKGNKCAQVFCSDNFVRIYPMRSKSEAGQALQDFADDVGVMDELVCDNAAEQTGPRSDFMKTVRHLKIKLRTTEPHTPKQNDAKRKIGKIKKRWRHHMITKQVPRRLWDYGLVYESEIMSRMARGPEGRTGVEEITGDSPDISEWLDFDFYDLVWYWDAPHLALMEDNPKLGRWLGVTHRVGSDMCYWVINENGNVLARTTVQHVPDIDLMTDMIRNKAEAFQNALVTRLDDANFMADNAEAEGFYMEDIIYDDIDDEEMVEQYAIEQDDYTDDAYDQYVGAELMVPHGDEMVPEKVIKRARGEYGNPIGRRNQNPILDTREYEVEMPDGTIAEYTANTIAENIYSQVDSEGHQYLMLSEIIDHKKDLSAITKDQGFTTSYNGNRVKKKTTKGSKLCVEWKDGTLTWVPLKELKSSNPVEVAEYAVTNQIVEEPAFAWWVKDVLR
jgi:hypothetical protein